MTELTVPNVSFVELVEGLITAGGTPTGIVAVIGSARAGVVAQPVEIASVVDARFRFQGGPLVDALELVFLNGARSVIAVRVGADPKAASLALTTDGRVALRLEALTPGTWGNLLQCELSQGDWFQPVRWRWDGKPDTKLPAAADLGAVSDKRALTATLDGGPIRVVRTLKIGEADTMSRVDKNQAVVQLRPEFRGGTWEGLTVKYLKAGGGEASDLGTAVWSSEDASLTLRSPLLAAGTLWVTGNFVESAPREDPYLRVAADRTVTREGHATGEVEFIFRPQPAQVLTIRQYREVADSASGAKAGRGLVATETYETSSGYELADALARSGLVRVRPGVSQRIVDGPFEGSGTWLKGGDDSDAVATLREPLQEALDKLMERDVNIVVFAGEPSSTFVGLLAGHVLGSVEAGRERIGVFDAPGSTVAQWINHAQPNERLVAVAPRLQPTSAAVTSSVRRGLGPAIAGRIASLPPHHSLTSVDIIIPDGWRLDLDARQIPGPVQKAELIKVGVLTVLPVPRAGHRVLRGVTAVGTDGQAFGLIPTRRTVDYARYQVRAASRPYLGRLNNERVRNALRATIDGALARMVREEMLVGYELDVTASRTDQKQGMVRVVITLQPTFSIEFIRVVLDLQ